MPQFNTEGPLKSNVSHLKIWDFSIFELEGSSLGIRPSIYDLKGCYKDNFLKSSHISDIGDEGIFALKIRVFTLCTFSKNFQYKTFIDFLCFQIALTRSIFELEKCSFF